MSDQPFVVSIAVPRPIDRFFTYEIDAALIPGAQVGAWVKVPFGKGSTHGFIVEEPKAFDEATAGFKKKDLKKIQAVGPEGSVFSPDVWQLCKFAQEYYRSPLGEVLHCAAPPSAMGLRSTRTEAKALPDFVPKLRPKLSPTDAQKAAMEGIDALAPARDQFKVALLEGVTGSGKTEVYLELARRTLALGKSVLILVPEIALTPQLHSRFEEGLGARVGLWHSALSDGKRRDLGGAIRKGEIRVVVGARSSVFTPLSDLGLIIVDEEHDSTYKQEDRVRYHARDLSVMRGKINKALVVLGSATPCLETLERAREGKYAHFFLLERVGQAILPDIQVVSLSDGIRSDALRAPFLETTLSAIRETIARGEQVMVFLNRRGFAAFLVCEDCGEVKECPECSISLTFHKKKRKLQCHVCGHQETPPDECPKCLSQNISPVGAGTESLEEELPGLIEGAIPIRLDRDQITSATRLEAALEEFREGRANLMLGTQMLVKGHDFPGVTLVVVVLADALFRWPDFRAPERAYQILTQVSGRAGRGNQKGKVLIQTFQTDHPVLKAIASRAESTAFLESERELRQTLGYPPYGRLVRLRIEEESREKAEKESQALLEEVARLENLTILGPSEAFLEKVKGQYRWDLLLKSKEIGPLYKAIHLVRERASREKWNLIVDVDPSGIG